MSYLKKRFPILLFKSWKAFGLFKGSFLILQYFVFKIKRYRFKAFKYPIFLRPGSTDLDVLLQFLGDQHYEMAYPSGIKYILDGGANIGLGAVFFANKLQDAQIVAVEPDEANFKILQKNTANYPQIKLVKAGLWGNSGWLNVYNQQEGEWALMVSESKVPTDISAYSIGDILRKNSFPQFDLIKLDIEGSEKEVFGSDDTEWLSKVKVLIIEFHDGMRPGGARICLSKIVQRPFSMRLKDENLIFQFD